MTAPEQPRSILDALSRLAQRTTTIGRKRRVVLYMDPDEIARLDVLKRRLSRPDLGDRASRAGTVRALIVWGLAEIDRIVPAPAANDNGGAP
jgi:hypothetical protein